VAKAEAFFTGRPFRAGLFFVLVSVIWIRVLLRPSLRRSDLLLFPARFIVSGGQLVLPSFAVITLIAFLGYRYLRRVREAAA
jgi:hypothetical protein